MYFYTYRITNTIKNKHYYGFRSSTIPPKDDLGFQYFSSSTDKEFMEDQKTNNNNYKYKILLVSTKEKCINLEIRLHQKFYVSSNTAFYNKANQTSERFTTTGCSTLHDKKEYTFVNKKTMDERRCSFKDMATYLNTTHIYNLKSGDCDTVKGWCLKDFKQNIPKNINFIIENLRYRFCYTDSGVDFVCTPKELMEKHHMDRRKLVSLILGTKKEYKNISLFCTYRDRMKYKNPIPSKLDTIFLFKKLDGSMEIDMSARDFSEMSGIPKSTVLSLVAGNFLSIKGWSMGWFHPYEEKYKTGNHNKYNNKDVKKYRIFNRLNGDEMFLDRDGLKERLPHISDSSISMFLNEKIKTLGGKFCLCQNKDNIPDSSRVKSSFKFINIDGRHFSGSVKDAIIKTGVSRSILYKLIKDKTKVTKCGWRSV